MAGIEEQAHTATGDAPPVVEHRQLLRLLGRVLVQQHREAERAQRLGHRPRIVDRVAQRLLRIRRIADHEGDAGFGVGSSCCAGGGAAKKPHPIINRDSTLISNPGCCQWQSSIRRGGSVRNTHGPRGAERRQGTPMALLPMPRAAKTTRVIRQ